MLSSNSQPVTVWYRFDKQKNQFFFNHIVDGPAAGPTPADPFNRGWARSQWQALAGQLLPTGQGSSPSLRAPDGTRLPSALPAPDIAQPTTKAP